MNIKYWSILWGILLLGILLLLVLGVVYTKEESGSFELDDYYRNEYRILKDENLQLESELALEAKDHRSTQRKLLKALEFARDVGKCSLDAQEMLSYAENKKQRSKVVTAYYFAISDLLTESELW